MLCSYANRKETTISNRILMCSSRGLLSYCGRIPTWTWRQHSPPKRWYPTAS